jgi:hypothetical protein
MEVFQMPQPQVLLVTQEAQVVIIQVGLAEVQKVGLEGQHLFRLRQMVRAVKVLFLVVAQVAVLHVLTELLVLAVLIVDLEQVIMEVAEQAAEAQAEEVMVEEVVLDQVAD